MNSSQLRISALLVIITAALLTGMSMAVLPQSSSISAQLVEGEQEQPASEEPQVLPVDSEAGESIQTLSGSDLESEESASVADFEQDLPEVERLLPDLDMDCTPVQRVQGEETQVKCVLKASPEIRFLVAEIPFPFAITKLIKVSAERSGLLGTLYPASDEGSTVFVSAIDWGNEQLSSELRPVHLNGLTLFVQTSNRMHEIQQFIAQPSRPISLLAPSDDPQTPRYETYYVGTGLEFDRTLIDAALTKGRSAGALEFLNLGLACYEKDPEECVQNLLDNLE